MTTLAERPATAHGGGEPLPERTRKPALSRISVSFTVDSDAYSDGLSTTVHPADSAGATFCAYSIIGADNKQFDYQDVNGNGQLDVWTQDVTRNGAKTVARPDGSNLPAGSWVPQWSPRILLRSVTTRRAQ